MNATSRSLRDVFEEQAICDLSILVVGYNSSSYICDCIGSIAGALTNDSYEILFVDNGHDNSASILRRTFPEVHICKSLGNVGFAAANDYLAEHANGRYLLLLNPDTRLYPGSLDILLEAAFCNPHYKVVGGMAVGPDGEPDKLAHLQLPSFLGLLRTFLFRAARAADLDVNSDIREVEALNGGFMMVRRDCWDSLGGLDKGFFLYAEELDFFKRLRDEGGRAALVAKSRIFHDFGSGDVLSPSRIGYLTTGNAHYFHKHFSSPYAYACIMLLWLTAMKRYMLGRLLAWRGEKYARMSRGFERVATAPWTWMWGYNSSGADPRKSS